MAYEEDFLRKVLKNTGVFLVLLLFIFPKLTKCCFLLAQGMAAPARNFKNLPKIKADIPLPKIRFEDIARQAGLNATHVTGGVTDKKYIIEMTGSGVALFDYDRDGWLDIFLVNGTTLEGFPPGQEPTNHLYHNNQNGTFTDVTTQTGLVHSGWGQGACVGDFDNDGFEDLFVTYYGKNVFYRNEGGKKFTDISEKSGLLNKNVRWATGCAFLDYDRDGKLDLFVANYVDFDMSKTPVRGANEFCQWKGVAVMCGPRGLPGESNQLFHNNGDGTFTDVSQPSGISKPNGYYGFTPLVADFDNDGWPDIYLSCDSTPSILYHNNHDGTFTDLGLISGVSFNEDGQEQAGMGVAAGDYDRDGLWDIFKTNFIDDVPNLYHNNGDGTFEDVSTKAGLAMNSRFLGWGCGFFDFDHDGWKDIYLVNGHVYPEAAAASPESPVKQSRLLYWNLHNRTFLDVSSQAGPGIKAAWCSRGASVGDLDNDGSLEIVVNNMNDPPSILKNYGDKKNWIVFKLTGTQSNRDGIGARVTLMTGSQKQIDEVRSGGSFISQNDLRLHFGLGDAIQADRVEIAWPSGKKEVLLNVKANQIVALKEGQTTVSRQTPQPKGK
jgi:enediyne biosynthesis protein E4